MLRWYGFSRFCLIAALVLISLPSSTSPASTRPVLAQGDGDIQVAYTAIPTAITLRMPGGIPPYTYAIDTLPDHGTLDEGSETAVLYTSAPGYTGPDTFTYTLTDSSGASRTATVALNVFDVPDLPDSGPAPEPIGPGAVQAVPNEYILHFAPGTSQAEIDAQVAASGGTILQTIPELNAVVVSLPSMAAITALGAEPGAETGVTYVEPNLIRYPTLAPNDTYLSYQWGFNNTNAYAAWNTTTGSTAIKIAVLDTGVDMNHPDLDNHLLPGYDYVDLDTWPQDTEGHGTHVAGTANAETNNAFGVAGMSWHSRTLPVRIIGPYGATSANIANGLIYAANQGAHVINMSLGGPGWVKIERDAVNYAAAHGAVIVAAAGNDNNGVSNYPASYDHVLSVASTNNLNQRSPFSNFGQFVDIAAPGSDIYSTVYNDSYAYSSGTSMASPHVAGLAALVWAAGNADTAAEVTEAILCTALDLGAAERDNYFGWGLIDAYLAVTYDPETAPTCLISPFTVPHDDFDDARTITAGSYTDVVNTRYATSWYDDPVPCAGDTFRTVWYTYTAPDDGIWSLDTNGSTYDTVLGVYTGVRGGLVKKDCNNDHEGTASAVSFVVEAGQTFYIMVSSLGYEGYHGTLTLHSFLAPIPTTGCYPRSPGSDTIICTAP